MPFCIYLHCQEMPFLGRKLTTIREIAPIESPYLKIKTMHDLHLYGWNDELFQQKQNPS